MFGVNFPQDPPWRRHKPDQIEELPIDSVAYGILHSARQLPSDSDHGSKMQNDSDRV